MKALLRAPSVRFISTDGMTPLLPVFERGPAQGTATVTWDVGLAERNRTSFTDLITEQRHSRVRYDE